MKNFIPLILLIWAPATLAQVSLDQVKEAIATSDRADWTAERQTIPERLRVARLPTRGGSVLDAADWDDSFFDVYREDRDRETTLPRSFDWRTKDGVSYMSPVLAQGDCGSCVAMASVATIESTLNIACGTPERTFDLSEQYVFSCGGGRCGAGWRVTQAVSFVSDHGVPDQACLPYAAGDGQDVECARACADADSRLVRDITWTRPTTGFINVDAIKQGLLQGPLLANMILFEDLEYYEGGVYRHVTGAQLGGHAVVLVGWDDSDSSWIVRNSWGPEWGDGGYFKVAWDDVSLPGRYTWLFNVASPVDNGICSSPR